MVGRLKSYICKRAGLRESSLLFAGSSGLHDFPLQVSKALAALYGDRIKRLHWLSGLARLVSLERLLCLCRRVHRNLRSHLRSRRQERTEGKK